MKDLSSNFEVDEQYLSALQFGDLFTQLYLLGPVAMQSCLDSVSKAQHIETAMEAWMKGYSDHKNNEDHAFPESSDCLPYVQFYNKGWSHSYVWAESVSGRIAEAHHG